MHPTIPTHARSALALLACAAFLVGGCASYTTLQSPRTLAPGKVQLGAGTAIISSSGGVGVLPEFGGRVGLANHVDIGAKYVMPRLLFADAKVQLLDTRKDAPLDLALDLGASHASFDSDDEDGSVSCNGLYPALLIGKDNWYAGAKATILFFDGSIKLWGEDESFSASGYASTDFVVGLVLGRGLQFLPEVNLHLNKEGEPLFIPAMSLVYNIP